MNDISVSIGCGDRKPKGWIGIDIRNFPAVDYVMNIGKERLPFKDNSVLIIEADHVFEHLYSDELFFAIEECFRVLKPQGYLKISVPKANTPAFYSNPDHKICFVEDTFSFFQVPAEGKDQNGYLKGFWHVSIESQDNPEAILVVMYPNKPEGKYTYKEIKLLGEWK